MFLSPLVGYTLAAFLNHRIHSTLGQRGVALIGPGCHIIAFLVNCLHPPYPVLVLAFVFAGFGNGLEDAAWNAWIGNMANANELLGILHGVYGLGVLAITPTSRWGESYQTDCINKVRYSVRWSRPP